MPGHCCVPFCNANYPSGPKVSVFSFPRDEELIKKWIEAIPKKDLVPTPSTKVCQRHFKPEDIVTETSGYDSKRKVTITVQLKNSRLSSEAVPSIFEENPVKQPKKVKKSPLKDNQGKDNIESSTRTNLIMEHEKSPEKSHEDTDSLDVEPVTPNSNSFSLPSPFKNLPNVTVCLKEEDRVPLTRELKGVKRSPSTGSSSSTGSTDAQKSASLAKRRKVEKPAPIVIGRQNDCYCWVCHRENVSLSCLACPRAYHFKCAGELSSVLQPSSDWVCPECQRILAAENVDTRSSTLAEISLDKLGALLRLSLNKMKQRAPIAFHQAVSLEHYPLYLHYVIHPMDFSLLEKNIKQKIYGCTEAFLADVKWMSHNSCVFNGTQHPLSSNAKNIVKACDQDMQEIEVCPDCFVHSVVRNKYWFSEVCRKPHPLVWAKLKGFPYWPAKVVRILDGNVDARFFGAHDRAWVPLSQCYHLSKEMPTTSKPKKKGNYEVALDELNVHVHLLIQKFGTFEYAPYRTSFTPEDKYLLYHGIDIDKVGKEEITIDNSIPQQDPKFLESQKENRFTSFIESEYEKSNKDETKVSESQSEIQFTNSLNEDGAKSPAFLFKQRKSTDSVISEKETPVTDSKSVDEPDEAKKSNASENSSVKKPEKSSDSEKLSDSDQLRKLELALERIKGYVSLNVDSEKENETESEENQDKKEEPSKNTSEEGKKVEIEKCNVAKSLFKETITLPVIESSSVHEEVKDVSVALEATKKTDSFFLKLNETIKSCKAKLGISEIVDELSSDESVADENDVSRSDEDDTSGSEAEEASDEDGEEDEGMEVSDEEMENEEDEDKLEDGESDAEEESEDDQESQSSETDIECTNEISPRIEISNLENVDDKKDPKEVTSEVIIPKKDSVKELTNDSNEAIITNPDMQVPEVTIDGSSALEIIGENSSSESSENVKENSKSPLSGQDGGVGSSKTAITPSEISINSGAQNNSSSVDSKNENSNINTIKISEKQMMPVNFSVNKNYNPSKIIGSIKSPLKSLVTSRVSFDERSEDVKSNTDAKRNNHVKSAENTSSKNEADDDDDEIYICTPTRPKSPPIIILDDDQENENSSISDTFAVKSPPYSTSVDSFSNEEIPSCRTMSDDEHDDTHEKSLTINRRASSEKLHKQQDFNSEEKTVNTENDISDLKNSAEKRKRKLTGSSSDDDDDDDDDIQIVTPAKKVVLTGAIRTFNKPNNDKPPTLKPTTPTMETVKRNLEKESLNQISRTPTSTESSNAEVHSPQDRFLSDQLLSPLNTENPLRSPVIDTSNMSDKDKEIIFLKRKLNCVVTAYQIQSFKCNQEKDELRHNMNLIIMEMRACLESDKKQAIDALSKKLVQEKEKCIEETKRKQWCANCFTESRYSCCWNTSYCSIDCQKHHFPEHRSSCTQVKNKNIEAEMKKKSAEKNENKKVIILTTNMKTPEAAQVSVSKSQIQVVPPPKNVPLQIATSSPNSNIQFVLAPVKSSTEPVVVTSSAPAVTSPKEHGLDSAQIISQVRNKSVDLGTAISLLKKKNIESTTLSLLKKKEEKLKKEENSKKEDKPKEETNLEDIYFPSPPRVTFEGYETTSPDPNIVLLNDDLKDDGDSETQESELPNDYSPEQDVTFSDTDEKDNEMINIGHGVEVKAKFLNKCLVYGKTAKKLTRCLVDVIFPDVKLLATCSAFGQKSNVTKLTRAALPARKVQAIIDFVSKRFPGATRSEIVLPINMKCKEARVIVNRKENDTTKKTMLRRMLAREKEGEVVKVSTATAPSLVATPPIVTSPVITSSNNKTFSNLLCVKSTPQNVRPFSMPSKSVFDLSAKSASGTNILRCNTQIVIRPKALVNAAGAAAVIQPPLQRKRETVKNLLAANKVKLPMGNLSKDGTQLVMSLDNLKTSSSVSQPVSLPTNTVNNNIRPYIIIGSQMNSVKPSSSVQNPVLAPAPATTPAPSHISK